MEKTQDNPVLDRGPPLHQSVVATARVDMWGSSEHGDFRGDLFSREARHIMRWAIDDFHNNICLSFIKRWFVIFVFERPKRLMH